MRKNIPHIIYYRKRGLMAALAVSFATFICSCTVNEYESGDGKYSYYSAEMATFSTKVEKIEKGELDDDRTILLSEAVSASALKKNYNKFIQGDSIRMMLYYNKASENEMTTQASSLIGFTPVYQPKIALTDTIKGEVKFDPVNFISAWKSKNNKYYNINFSVKTGVADEQKAHIIGLVCDSVSMNPTEGNEDPAAHKATIYIRLEHDQNNMPLYYSSEVFMSFSREKLLQIAKHYNIYNADEIEVKFSLNTFDGNKEVKM